MQKPISVILPVYNASVHLDASIDSVLKQSYTNFELLIVNDGSTDGSEVTIDRYRKIDGRIKVISRENKGLVYSLNEAISVASGDYIMRMDADDICLPGRIEEQLRWLLESKADLCGSWIKTFGFTVNRVRQFHTQDVSNKFQLLFNSCFAHPTVLAKAHWFKHNFYSADYEFCEDYELWCRMANQGAKLTNVPRVLLKYRIHGGQLTKLKAARQAELRASVALNYAKKNADFESLTLEPYLNRKGNVSEQDAIEAIQSLLYFGDKSSCINGIVATQVFLMLIRNRCINKDIRELLKSSHLMSQNRMMLIKLCKLIGIKHGNFGFKLLELIK
jgi:glycosyltransferase involved in cell wall biosynthesis